jgi:hypothetical protein
MQTIPFLPNFRFDPEVVRSMSVAYTDLCQTLGLSTKPDAAWLSVVSVRVTPEWEVIRIKATPAAFVGTVQAPDKTSALKTGIKQFNIRREDQSRLIVRPR